MKTTIVFYWAGIIKNCHYEHREEILDKDKMKVAQEIFKTGNNVMLCHGEINDIIFVDNKRFQQR